MPFVQESISVGCNGEVDTAAFQSHSDHNYASEEEEEDDDDDDDLFQYIKHSHPNRLKVTT